MESFRKCPTIARGGWALLELTDALVRHDKKKPSRATAVRNDRACRATAVPNSRAELNSPRAKLNGFKRRATAVFNS